MLFPRPVLPLGDVTIEVDLHHVVTAYGFGPVQDEAPCWEVAPLASWIGDGLVKLYVVSLQHVIPADVLAAGLPPLLDARLGGSGGADHQRLAALAALYLEYVLGKRCIASGDSRCAYAGGWADVVAEDESIVVECGTISGEMRTAKAMMAGETLALLPYSYDGDVPPAVLDRFDPPCAASCSEDEDERNARELQNDGRALQDILFILRPTQPLRTLWPLGMPYGPERLASEVVAETFHGPSVRRWCTYCRGWTDHAARSCPNWMAMRQKYGDDLSRAVEIEVHYGPRGGLRRVLYAIPPNTHVCIHANSDFGKNEAREALAFFTRQAMPMKVVRA